MRRIADSSKAALECLAAIEASLTNLDNEDLLDLADIFKTEPRTILGDMAFAEMARRNSIKRCRPRYRDLGIPV